jgi:2-polyprenyl-6-methoxyphenol hydroxylase-like FAD-dependent oxidoreductase
MCGASLKPTTSPKSNAMTRRMEAPVLIVGGGPVGLSCALELAWRGIESLLVERTDGVVRYSKMGGVAIRTMEFCRRWGIAEAVRGCGFPEEYPLHQVFCTSLAGYLLKDIPYPSMGKEPIPPESPERRQRCPQLWFDPVLAKAARECGRVTLRYQCELESLEQHANAVRGIARDVETGERVEIDAQYVIACDGAGSSIRRALRIDFEGEVLSYSTGIYFRTPGLVNLHNKGPAERYMLIGPEGMWGNLTVVDGDAYWRLTVTGARTKVEATDFDAVGALKRCLGTDAIPFEIDAVMPWRRSRLVAERFSNERIFLAGDAAHVTAPNGGYGMNTGIGDAVDLGWKIEGALAGWAGPGLLKSYEPERRPVAWRNVNAAAANFANVTPSLDYSGVLDDTPAGDAKRREIGEAFDRGTRGEWETLGVVLGYRYDPSPVIVPDGTAPTPDDPRSYVPTSRPGHRAPHAWLQDGRSTLDLFGKGYVMLRFGRDAPDPAPFIAAATRRKVPLSVVDIADPAIAHLYERKLVLVRPDGHTAWRGDKVPVDPLAVIDTVRGAG